MRSKTRRKRPFGTGRTQHAPRSFRSRYSHPRSGMGPQQEPTTKGNNKTGKGSKDMPAGNSAQTKEIKNGKMTPGTGSSRRTAAVLTNPSPQNLNKEFPH